MSESPHWKEGEIPEISGPSQFKEAKVVSENLKAMEKAENFYVKEMSKLFGIDTPSIVEQKLNGHHEKCFMGAMKMFRESKVEGEAFSSVCDKKLELKLEAQFKHFKLLNESKRQTEFTLKATFAITLILTGIAVYSMWRRYR